MGVRSPAQEEEELDQSRLLPHEQRGEYDFFLPNKKKERSLNSNANTVFTSCPEMSPYLPTYDPENLTGLSTICTMYK